MDIKNPIIAPIINANRSVSLLVIFLEAPSPIIKLFSFKAMSVKKNPKDKLSRWYFGGLASAGAACCTHPLDLLKVHLQTQQEGKLSIVGVTLNIIKKQGEWKAILSVTQFNIKNQFRFYFSIRCMDEKILIKCTIGIRSNLELKIPNLYCK